MSQNFEIPLQKILDFEKTHKRGPGCILSKRQGSILNNRFTPHLVLVLSVIINHWCWTYVSLVRLGEVDLNLVLMT